MMNNFESSSKSMLDINCISSGSTLLIKIDSVNVLRSQFDKFLEKLINEERTYYDVKLPLFIVDSFSKLFKYWVEIPKLQELVNRDVFEEVFKEMNRIFGTEVPQDSPTQKLLVVQETNQPSKLRNGELNNLSGDLEDNSCEQLNRSSIKQLNAGSSRKVRGDSGGSLNNQLAGLVNCQPTDKLINQPNAMNIQSNSQQKISSIHPYFKFFCNDCNEKIEIVNDDPQLSYDLHIQSEDHLNRIAALEETSAVDFVGLNTSSPADLVKLKSSAQSLNLSHSKSSVFNNSSSSIVRAENGYKLPSVHDPFCEPCCKKIIGSSEMLQSHVLNKSHQKQENLYRKSRNLLKQYQAYITITDEHSFAFVCHICVKSQVGTNCFIQHCEGREHKTNFREITSKKC